MPSASVVLRSCSSPVEASESKDTTAGAVAHLSKTITTINILHHCLGHNGEARQRRVMLIMGGNSQGQHLDNCTVCIQAKPMRPVIRSGPPLPEKCIATCSEDTFQSAIDDHSRYAMVGLLRRKSEAVAVIGVILRQIQEVEILHSDQGGEYMGRKMAQLLEELGIRHIPTPSYTPEYNGVAKHFNRTVQEMQRSYLLDSRLEVKY